MKLLRALPDPPRRPMDFGCRLLRFLFGAIRAFPAFDSASTLWILVGSADAESASARIAQARIEKLTCIIAVPFFFSCDRRVLITRTETRHADPGHHDARRRARRRSLAIDSELVTPSLGLRVGTPRSARPPPLRVGRGPSQ